MSNVIMDLGFHRISTDALSLDDHANNKFSLFPPFIVFLFLLLIVTNEVY